MADPTARSAAAGALLRDPAAWVVAAVVASALGAPVWWMAGPAALAPSAAAGAAGLVPGAIVTACLGIQVARGRFLPDADRRIAWAIVVAALAYWLSGLPGANGVAGSGALGAALTLALLAVYPAVAVGMTALSRVPIDHGRRVSFVLDQLMVGWAGAMVLWHVLLYPLGRSSGAGLLTVVGAAVSPSFDLAMIFLAVVVANMPRLRFPRSVVWLLVPLFACVFATDLSYAVQTLSGRDLDAWSGVFQGWFWIVAAIIWFRLQRGRAPSDDERPVAGPSFAWLPYAAIAVAFVVPALASWEDLTMLEQHVPASMLLIGLVLARLAVTARDHAQLVAADEARRTAIRFDSLVQNGSDVVALADVDSRVRYVTRSAERVLGVDPAGLVGTRLTDLLHPDDAATGLAELADVAARPGATIRAEWRMRRPDGSYCETEMALSNMLAIPEVDGIVLTGRDIGDRKALERQLTFQALHDPLTGLANRSLFGDRVEHALARAGRRRGSVAVLFIDLDDFKRINDSHGHGTGDSLLVAAAARVRDALRGGDTAARWGGDEFAVLLEDVDDPASASAVAERIEQALRQPFALDGLEAFVSASIGIAIDGDGALGHEELLRDADVAMYVAKARGKQRCETFHPSMHEEVSDRLELEADLRHAVERHEFEVHYQPVWATDTRQMVGVEALVRWRHPRRGLVLPGEFIGVAEETGLIVQIGRRVLHEACHQAVAWDRLGGAVAGLALAVNLSPRQLREPDLVEAVAEELDASGLRPDRLNLEITESVLVDDSAAIVELLERLKSIGVRISVDDFGTGYSSLSYLRRLPVDTLKIAKEFVDVLTHGAKDEALAQAVVALAQSLQLDVVAEGVELEAQLELLRDMGCRLGQGFLISPAVPAGALPSVLTGGMSSSAA